MSAYYNEIDAFAAAWLRELIKAGHIAPGEVDERSIAEVEPEDLRRFTQCHFFAGIGVWSHALRAAGWPDDTAVWTGSCPCQSFSASGKRGGFSDQRHLWPAWFRLVRECRPDTIFGEQVASKDGLAWFDLVSSDLEGAGYAVGAADTCAAGVGAPHIRQRLYFVADTDSERRREARRSESGRGTSGRLSLGGAADTQRDGGRTDLAGREAQGREVDGRNRQDGGLADTHAAGRGGRGTGEAGAEPGAIERPERLCPTGELGHAHIAGSQGLSKLTGAGGSELLIGETESAGRTVGDTEGKCFDRITRGSKITRGTTEQERRQLGGPSLTNGFWRDAQWLWCRDGKYRPVEPGTFPLAHGAPARVGRLRGYGNAINAPQAKAFIESYREVVAGRK